MQILRVEKLYKSFDGCEVISGITFEVQKGEVLAVIGPSGSGKSTLLRCVNLLEKADSGSIVVAGDYLFHTSGSGKAVYAPENELRRIRLHLGLVFQNFNLIPRTNALKNVELPMMYAGLSQRARTARAQELMALVEMDDRMFHQPNELSGGQKQRVAIARAMANDPAIILADEPTGALDSKTGRLVMNIFHQLNRKRGKTVVLITHNRELAKETGRIVTMRDGMLYGEA